LHHNSILFKSSWTLVCIAEIFSPEMCIVESSAYISVLQFKILNYNIHLVKNYLGSKLTQIYIGKTKLIKSVLKYHQQSIFFQKLKFKILKGRSFICKINNNGPSIEL
jgi:uncharacterized membrane protein YwaF